MKAGENGILFVESDIDIGTVESAIITLKGLGNVTKRYPDHVSFQEGHFIVPVTQEDNLTLSNGRTKTVQIEAQFNLHSKAVVKSQISSFTISNTLATEVLEGNTPSAVDISDITFKFDGEVIVAKVDAENVEAIVETMASDTVKVDDGKFVVPIDEDSIVVEEGKIKVGLSTDNEKTYFSNRPTINTNPLFKETYYPLTVLTDNTLTAISTYLLATGTTDVICSIKKNNEVVATSTNTVTVKDNALYRFTFAPIEMEVGEYSVVFTADAKVLGWSTKDELIEDDYYKNIGTKYIYDNNKIRFFGKIEYLVESSLKDTITTLKAKTENSVVMNYIYVAVDGSDVSGDGSKNNPFATIYHANETITDNSKFNRYTVVVGNGTYTDLQERYTGVIPVSTDDMQGVVTKDYVYYESEDINRPDLCVIEWDGIVGLSDGDKISANVSTKCPFHIFLSNQNMEMHGHIKGFTFKCKNTRYAFHGEANSRSVELKYNVENCVFEFGGRPDTTDYATRTDGAIVGFGVGFGSVITFRNCMFKALEGYEARVNRSWYTHDGTDYLCKSLGYPIRNGASITIEGCNLGGYRLEAQSLYDYEYDMPNIFKVERCVNAPRILFRTMNTTKVNNFQVAQLGNDFAVETSN